MDSKTVKKGEILSFEQALEQLEFIVKQLEKGELSLEESLQCFSQGITLSNTCLKKLNNAEKKVNQLITEKNGQIKLQPLTLEGEL